MRKLYSTPQLFVHGDVRQITSASEDSDRQDRMFDSAGMMTGTGTGSLDQCYFEPNNGTQCIIAPGQG